MKKIYNTLISTKSMIVLFVLYATAMGVATFIENDYGTTTARTLVYNSFWFEIIMFLLAINMLGNIIRFKMFQKKKWAIFLLHASFFLLLIGSAITRYISFEGMLVIREGETTDIFTSYNTFLKIDIDNGIKRKNTIQKKLNLSRINAPFTDNHYHFSTDFDGKNIDFKILEYIPKAEKLLDENKPENSFLKVVFSTEKGRRNSIVENGSAVSVSDTYFTFNQIRNKAVNIIEKKDSLYILSPYEGTYMRMTDQKLFPVYKDSLMTLHFGSLYQTKNLSFVIPNKPVKGKIIYQKGNKDSSNDDLIKLKIKTDKSEKIVYLSGSQYGPENPKIFQIDGLNYRINFGSVQKKLPFQIQLRDFQLEKYSGSEMPKSYASEITVIDKKSSFDYRIFMNNPLDYQNYKIYQSSYSITPTFEESHLSVNHDFWGTWISYIGYALLYFGLIMILFVKGSRFGKLKHLTRELQNARNKTLIWLLVFISTTAFAQEKHNQKEILTDSIVLKTIAPADKANNFAKLVIQDYDGRMKPINTYASELLRKLSKHDDFTLKNGEKISANQVLTGMISYPEGWAYIPIIYLERGDVKVRELLGIDKNQKYTTLENFFNEKGEYRLQKEIEEAQKKRIKSKFDKDIINISGRVNLLNNTLFGNTLRIFPIPNAKDDKWHSWKDIDNYNFDENSKNFVKNAIPLWTKEIFIAKETNDYQLADKILKGIDDYQRKYGAKIYPDKDKIKWEIFYNKHDAFRSLFWQFMMLSLVILFFAIAQIFYNKKWIKYSIKALFFISLLLFLWMTFFLGLRWYISGHAPWSNAFESIVFVAFATVLFGLYFGWRSALTLGATIFVASMLLMIAHWNWIDPQIENLNPVLNSFWLDIHVSVIVASYGPFTLGMILGILSLFLMSLINKKNKEKLLSQIKELTYITEMALIIGLVMLTIGNFLGAQWANESWGRYWGWDPKETWALVSIVVYAIVIHARFVPGMRGIFAFNFMSVISFASIVMTYFGVNFYLSGLHSYAQGEPQKTPVFIVYFGLGIIILGILAYLKHNKYLKNKSGSII